MNQIQLPGTDLKLSRLGFGTASLLSAGGASQRADLLQLARDQGFTHFDTAPLYGFGHAERDLGRAFGNSPDVTIASKVGLRSPGGDDQSAAGAILRKGLGRIIPALSAARADFALGWAQRGLEGSLRRLKRETIDLYLLHEPRIEWLDHDGWLRWLEDERTRGRIRHFGLAGAPSRLAPFLAAHSPLGEVLQLGDSIDGSEADVAAAHRRALQITYGYVRASPGASVPAVLAAALERNRTGCVIYGTRQADRLREAARSAA